MGFGLNKEIIERIVKELGLQTTVDKIPTEIIASIQPVLISNPRTVTNVVKRINSSGTIFTTPTDKDFYLQSISLSAADSGNAVDRQATVTIVMPTGEEVTIVKQFLLAGVVGADNDNAASNHHFLGDNGILLKKGSAVIYTLTADSGSCTITGYERDVV